MEQTVYSQSSAPDPPHQDVQAKKPYETPQLRRLGSVKQLTGGKPVPPYRRDNLNVSAPP